MFSMSLIKREFEERFFTQSLFCELKARKLIHFKNNQFREECGIIFLYYLAKGLILLTTKQALCSKDEK